LLGATGAALFYGDAIITPALSVLSAIEGMKTVPGLESMSEPVILGLSLTILIGLFALQARGTPVWRACSARYARCGSSRSGPWACGTFLKRPMSCPPLTRCGRSVS
jgi:hypothetical protein